LAHTKSAKKSIRIIEEKRIINKSRRSSVRTLVLKAEKLIISKEQEPAETAVKQATTALDKAAQKKLIHSNNASRHKSRLMKKYNTAFSSKD